MEGIRRDSATASRLVAALEGQAFRLIDVGCSGGLDAAWDAFGDRLHAWGFDPSLYEIRRLRAAEASPNRHYVAGFVGLPDGHPLKGSGEEIWRLDPWRRVAAKRTADLQKARAEGRPHPGPYQPPPWFPPPGPAEQRPAPPPRPAPAPPALSDEGQQDLMQRNQWREAALADQTIHLPDFLAAEGIDDLDFIKIDVDGTDFEILRSIEAALGDLNVLGVCIEVNYHGGADPNFNTFHNVDRFMRANGFDLFHLTVRTYASAALPFPYEYAYAAQTTNGRPIQGDALYLRDFGHRPYGLDAADWPDAKLIKLAALYALFGLLDQAAELVTAFPARFAPHVDVEGLLDLMTQEIQAADPHRLAGADPFTRYADYMAAWEADDPRFFQAYQRRLEAAQEAEGARARVQALEARQAAQAVEAERLRDRALQAEAALRAVTGSASWRLTAPLRRLMGAVRRRR